MIQIHSTSERKSVHDLLKSLGFSTHQARTVRKTEEIPEKSDDTVLVRLYSDDPIKVFESVLEARDRGCTGNIGFLPSANPKTRYPAFENSEDAVLRISDACRITQAADTYYIDLSKTTCDDPSEEYARCVQAIMWTRQVVSPHTLVMPNITPERTNNRSTAAAQMAAIHDLGVADVFWHTDPLTDDEKLKQTAEDLSQVLLDTYDPA